MADADRISMDSEDDGDRLGSLSGRLHIGRRHREDEIDIQVDQFGRELGQLVDAFRPAILNRDVLPLDIAELT